MFGSFNWWNCITWFLHFTYTWKTYVISPWCSTPSFEFILSSWQTKSQTKVLLISTQSKYFDTTFEELSFWAHFNQNRQSSCEHQCLGGVLHAAQWAWLCHLHGEKKDAADAWKAWMCDALVAVAGPFRASLFFFGRTRSPCVGATPSDISGAPQSWEVEHVSFPRSLGKGLKRLSPGRR